MQCTPVLSNAAQIARVADSFSGETSGSLPQVRRLAAPISQGATSLRQDYGTAGKIAPLARMFHALLYSLHADC